VVPRLVTGWADAGNDRGSRGSAGAEHGVTERRIRFLARLKSRCRATMLGHTGVSKTTYFLKCGVGCRSLRLRD